MGTDETQIKPTNEPIVIMGQARQRGTFEERHARAIDRNKALHAAFVETKNGEVLTLERRYGTQRLATRLIQMGRLQHSPVHLPIAV